MVGIVMWVLVECCVIVKIKRFVFSGRPARTKASWVWSQSAKTLTWVSETGKKHSIFGRRVNPSIWDRIFAENLMSNATGEW